MHVLLLSTSLPPNTDSQTIRTSYLLSEFTALGHTVTMMTPGAGSTVSDSVELFPPPIALVHTDRAWFQRLAGFVDRAASSRLASALLANIGYRALFPDVFAGWDRLAIAAARRIINAHRPHVIVSASGSPTAHLAAAELRRTFRIPWVADYGDPWTFVDREYRPWFAPLSARAERNVLPHADHVVFTTRECAQTYAGWLGVDMPPHSVIPYGYRPEECAAMGGTAETSGALTFAHVGAAYVANRDLRPFIGALGAVARSRQSSPRLRIIGNHSKAFEHAALAAGLATRAVFRQRVSYQEAIQHLAESGVLVIVGNKARLQIPGKIFPALGSGKPILYLRQMPRAEDPALRYLNAVPGVVQAANVHDEIAAALEVIFQTYPDLAAGAAERATSPEIRALSADNLSRQFASILADVSEAGGVRAC